VLQHTATHCMLTPFFNNGLCKPSSATDCNTLQQTAADCNTLHCNTLQHPACSHFPSICVFANTPVQQTATHCNIVQHTATQRTATHCNTLYAHTFPRYGSLQTLQCNRLQHTAPQHICATDFNTVQHPTTLHPLDTGIRKNTGLF